MLKVVEFLILEGYFDFIQKCVYKVDLYIEKE